VKMKNKHLTEAGTLRATTRRAFEKLAEDADPGGAALPQQHLGCPQTTDVQVGDWLIWLLPAVGGYVLGSGEVAGTVTQQRGRLRECLNFTTTEGAEVYPIDCGATCYRVGHIPPHERFEPLED